jgi:hypothetical protein
MAEMVPRGAALVALGAAVAAAQAQPQMVIMVLEAPVVQQ